jgi:molecular chaperone DnaK
VGRTGLSSTLTRRTDLRFAGAVARVELTRAQLEQMTADLLDRVAAITARTVELARSKGVDYFDDVFLVGGMSQMPAIATMLRDRLGLNARLTEPHLAVAKGAALYAVICQVRSNLVGDGMSRHTVEEAADRLGMSSDRVRSIADKRVAGVLPRAFGVMVVDPKDPLAMTNPFAARKIILHLLWPNTALPADSGPYPGATVTNNQRIVEIEVWEQAGPEPSEELADNVRIGSGILHGLPPRPAGSPFEV